MTGTEIGLVARARGLVTGLLTRNALEELAGAVDLAALARRLTANGALDAGHQDANVLAIDRAAGARAAARLRTLRRWEHRRPGTLDVFFAHLDRRSLRALLRGAAQGAAGDARLAGLVPTPTLPWQTLSTLASQPTAAAVARELLLRRYPDADRVIAPAEHAPTELFALEAALLDGFARRASRAAARDRHLRTFVRDTLDVGNAITALVLAADPPDVDPAQLYVTGGQWLTKDTFVTAARAHDRAAASALVAAAFARSPLARVVSGAALQPGVIERTFLTMTLARLKRRARQEPLDTAVLLRVLLLIEAQVRDLRTLAWGATLGAPPSLRVHYLVTPP